MICLSAQRPEASAQVAADTPVTRRRTAVERVVILASMDDPADPISPAGPTGGVVRAISGRTRRVHPRPNLLLLIGSIAAVAASYGLFAILKENIGDPYVSLMLMGVISVATVAILPLRPRHGRVR